jgi:menaquinone-dependent protoporphyrinogen IX oxidase
MRTLILNGSPKGNSQNCNSRIFSEEFVRNMKNPCEVKCIAKADYKELAQYIKGYDTIIFIMPLYIHSMPGVVMKFIEHMEPAEAEGKSIGFIIQAGFPETAQEKYVERYFESLAKKLNYDYLGTVSKGEAAGIYMYPKMFKKVLKLVADLGAAYEVTHAFDKEIVKKLGEPYELPKRTLRLLKIVNKLGLSNIGWHRELKKHNAFDKRLDKPFLSAQ